jgi:hypothetical protein
VINFLMLHKERGIFAMPIKQYKVKDSKIEAVHYTGRNFQECCSLFTTVGVKLDRKGDGSFAFLSDENYPACLLYCHVSYWFVKETLAGNVSYYAVAPGYFKSKYEEIVHKENERSLCR